LSRCRPRSDFNELRTFMAIFLVGRLIKEAPWACQCLATAEQENETR
jgi:hypothetical protein